MPASSSTITMFHRRLLLIVGLMAVGIGVLVVQLGRLTLAKGAELRTLAESRLVTLEWMPTSRGRVLDRQGRVVAKDRPSFDITVDYRVISGEWASAKAAAVAKKLNRQRWNKMPQEERRALIEAYRAPFLAHVEAMWDRFADTARLNRGEIDDRRDRIIWQVERRYESVKEARYTKGIDAKLAEGREITEDVEEEILKEVRPEIEEQKSPHVVLPKVEDPIGFAFGKLVGEQVEIEIPKLPGAAELEKPWMEPLMPGLMVANAGDREYPLEAVTVDMDLGSLPGPMKQPGKRAKITVEGVGYHILGRVETNSYADRSVEVTEDGKKVIKTIPGHASERVSRLKADLETGVRPDPAFAEHVLAPDNLNIPENMRDLGRYEFNDDAGYGGIEESREDELRGLRGLTVSQLDTGKRTAIEHVPGRDVQLTIDVALQARVQAAMSPEFGLAVAQPWRAHENPTVPPGTVLNGAAVVLDVESGDILALVTTPSISRGDVRTNPERVFKDPLNKAVNMPWLDRAIARPYPPGSIVKALILNGAVKLGKHNLDSTIDCTGHLFPDKPNEFRCWIYKGFRTTHNDRLGHGLSAPEGLMVSCNIYFFTLGMRLGPDGIRDTFTMFGIGQPRRPWDLGVGMEFAGELGRRDEKGRRLAITTQDAIQMAIGQGPVSWTPLHAADAYATIARGGKRVVPRIVNEPSSRQTEDLGLDPRAVKEALEGLSLSVNDERGTGNHVDIPKGEGSDRVFHFADLPNIKVWGKTGTAQAPTIFTQDTHKDPKTGKDVAADPLFDRSVEASEIRAASHDDKLQFPPGRRALHWGDHSWFVVLVGHEDDQRPLYAISVMMEYAGSGGKVSGPIIAQIIRALMSEGYLQMAGGLASAVRPFVTDAIPRWRITLVHAGWLAVLAGLALTTISVYIIDLGMRPDPGVTGGLAHEASAQLMFAGVGFFAAVVVALPHYRIIGYLSWPAMVATLGLLVFLLIPGVPDSIVRPINGARAWINLGLFKLQPSELSKIAFVLVVAQYLRFRRTHRKFLGLVPIAIIAFVPLALILKQPDMGTALVFIPSLFAILVAAGARMRHLIVIVLGAGLALPAVYPLLKPYQRARITAVIGQIRGEREGAYGINYQSFTAQALAGSGEMAGSSDAHARALVHFNRLPERHNDMIFSVVVARFGFLGGLLVFGLYAMWLLGALATAAICKDPFGRLVCVGLAAFIATQVLVNVGMNIGLLPIIGITLPFMSHGGSSMITVWIMTGLIVNIAMRKPVPPFRPSFEYGEED